MFEYEGEESDCFIEVLRIWKLKMDNIEFWLIVPM